MQSGLFSQALESSSRSTEDNMQQFSQAACSTPLDWPLCVKWVLSLRVLFFKQVMSVGAEYPLPCCIVMQIDQNRSVGSQDDYHNAK